MLFVFATISITVFSQVWMEYLPAGKRQNELTFFEYRDAFRAWCREKGIDKEGYFINSNGERQKAGGWKQFRRWETEMEMMGNYDRVTGEFVHYRGINERIQEAFRNQGVVTDNISGNWVNLGYDENPGSIGGYFGIGRINTIAFHPTDPDRYWIGAPRGGIWATVDNGLSWTPLSDFIGHIGVSAIGIPPDFDVSNTIYIGTGDRGHWRDGGIGILKSTDGGATWQETCRTFDFGEHYIGRILIDPNDPEKQFACSSYGIYRTANGWQTDAFVPDIWAIDMEMHPTDHDTLYASTRQMWGYSKVLRSLNGGVTWDTVLSRPGIRTDIAVSPDEPDWIYAIVANDDNGLEGIYRSTDAGNSFTKVFDGMVAFNNLLGRDCYGIQAGGQADYDLAIAANPQDASDVWIGGINVWRSTDGGYNWTITHHWSVPCNGTTAPVHADQHCFAFQNEDQVLFICNDGELLRSEYGFFGPGPFIDKSDGLVINQIYRMSNSQQDWDEIIMGLQDNSTVLWTDGDLEFFTTGDGTDVLINPDNDNVQYRCGNGSYPEGTMDHWGASYFQFSVSDESDDWFKCFRCDPSSSNIIYYGLHKLWKSTDFGINFSLLWAPPDTTVIKQMAVAPSDPDVIFFSNKENLYRTDDGGSSWYPLTANLPAEVTTEYVTEIVIKEDDPNTIWLSVSGWGATHVIQSTNSGSTWTDISQGLPSAPISDIIQDASFTTYPILYAGGFWGVYVKLGDQEWLPFNTDLPNLTVTDLDIYYAGGKLRAATFGRGFWESDLYSVEAGMQGIWTGLYNTNWNDYRNWQYMGIPDINSDVVIPSGCVRNPHIYAANATCKNIIVEEGVSLNISGYELTVTGDAEIHGALRMHVTNSKLTVQGDVSWEPGSSFVNTGTGPSLNVAGDWTFHPGAYIDLSGTETRFFGSISSNLYLNEEDCTFGQVKVDKTAPSSLYYSGTSTANMTVDSNFLVTSTGKFNQQSNKYLTVKGNLDAQGSFYQQNGTYNCINGGTIYMNSVSYFDTLIVNHSTFTILLSDIEVRGQLDLRSGLLNIFTHKLDLLGDLKKSPGGSISMTSGKVVMMGNSEQKIYSDIYLANVEMNINSDTLRLLNGADVTIDSLDWTDGFVSLNTGSSLTINELADDGIRGCYRVRSGTTLNIANPTGSVDLNGKLNISGGTVNVYGGNHASYWPGSGNAELTMSGGTLDFKDRGIYVQIHPTYTFTDNITGGTIRTSGGFQGDHTGFNPTGGTIELYGTNNGALGLGTGSNYFKININKGTGAPQLDVMNNLDINNDLLITAGDLDINGYTVDVAGFLEISGKLTMLNAASTLNVGSSVTWKPGSSSYILDGIITFGTNWSFLDGTSAMLAGNSTVKVIGNNPTIIQHKDFDARFKNLVIEKTGSLTTLDEYSSYPLRVDGNLTVKTPNTLRILNADLKVAGTFLAESNCNVQITNGGSIDATYLTLQNNQNLVNGSILTGDLCSIGGSLNFTDGGTVVFDDLTLYGSMDINAGSFRVHDSFYQAAASQLILDGGSFILDRPYTGAMFGFAGTTSLNSGIFEISYEGIMIGTTGTVNFNGGDMRIGGNFQASFANTFMPTAGKVEFINTGASNINVINGNYFNQLAINKSTGASPGQLANNLIIQDQLLLQSGELQTMGKTLTVNGDLLIQSAGLLTAGASEIYVGGSWTNNRGTAGFSEGTSWVTFDSPQPGTISPETFYNVDVEKALATGQYLSIPNNSTMTVLNKLTLADGVLLMGANSTLNVNGNLHIKSGGGLNGNPNEFNTVINLSGHWWDYNTSTNDDQGFIPGNSTVNFTGSADQDIIAYSGVDFYDLNIQNSGHTIVAHDDITVEGDFTIVSGNWSQAATGLTHTFMGDFTVPDPANWLDAVNTVMFEGTGQQNLTNTAGNWLNFGTVVVDRPALAESGSLNISTHLGCSDELRVESGEVIFDGYRLYCADNLVILASGELNMLNGSNLFMGDNAAVYVNGGILNIWAAANNRSSVTRWSSGHFSFLVENGGVIDATYTDFEYMGQRGLNLEGTGLFGGAQPLNYCNFRHGEAGSALLTINTTQEVTLYNVDFPPNTWSGTYNVAKEATSGNVIMHNASGSFGGPDFEYDPYGLVHWPSTGVWEGDYSTEWHDRANWRFDYEYPNGSTEVVIPPGTPYSPVLSMQEAYIQSLKMYPGTFLMVMKDSLYVNTVADIAGQLNLGNEASYVAEMFCDSIIWQPASSALFTDRGRINIYGNMFIKHGSDLNETAGIWNFYGDGDSRLICHDTARINHLSNYKNAGYCLKLEGDTLAQLTCRSFRNGPGATLKCPSSQEWIFLGYLRNTDNGHYCCENGTITLKGNQGSYFRPNDGDYFNNLTIETSTLVSLTSTYSDTLRIFGDLVINSSAVGSSGITANAFKILVWGDWINNNGINAFAAGTSKVLFMDPSVPQNVDGNTVFYNLTAGSNDNSVVNFYQLNYINNVMESYFTTNVYGSLYTNIVYSDNDPAALNIHGGGYMEIQTFHQGAPVTVTSGMFEAHDLAQDYITGNYTVTNGLISLGQTTGSNDSHDLYYANLTINGGDFWFIGGNRQSNWPRSPGSASVTMTSGDLELQNQGVFISSGNFTENITGGRILVFLDFGADATCTTFHPAGGTVELYGYEDCSFSMPEPNCWFYNLHLSKTGGGGAYPSSNMRVRNEFRLNAGTYMETDGYLITVGP